jgi:hypothetical protein
MRKEAPARWRGFFFSFITLEESIVLALNHLESISHPVATAQAKQNK